MIMIDSAVPKIKRLAADVAAAIVDGEKEAARAGWRAAGRRRVRRQGSTTSGRTSVRPPLMPVSGDATMFRTRSWVSDGRNPASRTAANEAVGHGVGQAAKLQAGARGELKITAAELAERSGSAGRAPYRLSARRALGCAPLPHPPPGGAAARLGSDPRQSRPPS